MDQDLRKINTHDIFSAITYKRNTFYGILFAIWQTKPLLETGGLPFKKRISSQEVQIFPF